MGDCNLRGVYGCGVTKIVLEQDRLRTSRSVTTVGESRYVNCIVRFCIGQGNIFLIACSDNCTARKAYAVVKFRCGEVVYWQEVVAGSLSGCLDFVVVQPEKI
ncbi:MAG: hypothetical protein ACD_39C01207G0001 [uncultured bacterium]|nr:MAG: hypothetical protein ACD_39C01207G0001 [uncultured bacterium]